MKKMLCLSLTLLFFGLAAIAQKKTITGKVTNQLTGEPLQGVSILVDKQKGGTTTKADGTYSVVVNSGGSTLIFSYVGFTPQTVATEGKTVVL